jgi:hypothetical protein
MCCLRYEHDFYVQSRRRFPKEGRILTTSRGEERVVSCDIFHDRVTLRSADGDARVIGLAELREDTRGGFGEPGPETPILAALAEMPADGELLLDTRETAVLTEAVATHDRAASAVVDDADVDADDAGDETVGDDASDSSPAERELRRKRRRGRRGGRRLRAAEQRRAQQPRDDAPPPSAPPPDPSSPR